MKTFKSAIIGLGNIGFESDAKISKKYILSYARAFNMHKGFDLIAGFDIDKNKCKDFQEKYRVPGYRYNDLQNGLSGLDVAVISTPAKDHLMVLKDVVAFLQPRMIVMEKPLALNLKQAEAIAKIAKDKKILFYVNYFRRIDPGIRRLKEGIRKNRWGKLKHLVIYYGQDLLNNGSHFIDLMIYLLGSPNSLQVLHKSSKRDKDFIALYKNIQVYFKSSIGLKYNLKEMDFVFEQARVRYSCKPSTELMLPKHRSCFGLKELTKVENRDLCLDLERYTAITIDHIYKVLLGREDIRSTAQTALDSLKLCFDIIKRGK